MRGGEDGRRRRGWREEGGAGAQGGQGRGRASAGPANETGWAGWRGADWLGGLAQGPATQGRQAGSSPRWLIEPRTGQSDGGCGGSRCGVE